MTPDPLCDDDGDEGGGGGCGTGGGGVGVADRDALWRILATRRDHRHFHPTPVPRETIERLLEERNGLYRKTAHQELETDGLTFPEITTGIIESARYFFATL